MASCCGHKKRKRLLESGKSETSPTPAKSTFMVVEEVDPLEEGFVRATASETFLFYWNNQELYWHSQQERIMPEVYVQQLIESGAPVWIH